MKGVNTSMSGTLVYIEDLFRANKYNKIQFDPKTGEQKVTIEDLCCSLQENLFAMLIEITERAMAHINCSNVLIVVVVGCNLRLQEMVTQMCYDRANGEVYAPDDRFCIYNNATIAQIGLLQFRRSDLIENLFETVVTQKFRTDEVYVSYRKNKFGLFLSKIFTSSNIYIYTFVTNKYEYICRYMNMH